jgi:hypothetical protein
VLGAGIAAFCAEAEAASPRSAAPEIKRNFSEEDFMGYLLLDLMFSPTARAFGDVF